MDLAIIKFAEILATFCDESIDSITPLEQSGSSRTYFRIQTPSTSYIGTQGQDISENLAFIYFSKHFLSSGIRVPAVLGQSSDNQFYIQEDLGDQSLYQLLLSATSDHSNQLYQYYQEAIDLLVEVHTKGSQHINFSQCYPTAEFDQRAIAWDLDYFKYYFLKLNDIVFDEYELYGEFDILAQAAASIERPGFMVRDFQSRNIMLAGDKLALIDFQGGRKGPLQYDLVSLLWQAKANLPMEWKESLKDYYFNQIRLFYHQNKADFEKGYWLFILIRTMQVLGAYGLRGIVQGKEHFLQSIPFALENLRYLLEEQYDQLPDIPSIRQVFLNYYKQYQHV